MAEVIAIHIWMHNKKRSWTEPEVINRFGNIQKGKRIILDVDPGTTIPEMKSAVAAELDKWKRELRSYYVVAVVQRDDGEVGYKTIVPTVTVGRKRKK